MTPSQAILLLGDIGNYLACESESCASLSYPNDIEGYQRNFAAVLRQAAKHIALSNYEVVLWHSDIRQAAIRGRDAFVGERIYAESLPQANCWWLYEEAMGFSPSDYPDLLNVPWWTPEWCCIAHYIYPSDRILETPAWDGGAQIHVRAHGLMALWARAGGNGKDGLRISWDPGTPYGDPMPARLAACVAMQQFLNLPFVAQESEQANHSTRKLAKRRGHKPPQAVRVVTLRRSEHSHSISENTREYTCQWMVSGHWRRLHEPRKSDGTRIVYVRPHIKGPDHAPLKAPTKTVYVAKR